MKWKISLAIFLGLVLWISIDLLRPVGHDLREFNSPVVARLDTDMWRAYYERHPVKLFFQLAHLMRLQFGAPYWRSWGIAYQAAKAAFVFKDGKNRADYERALPYLRHYYSAIHKMSTTDFDIEKAAVLELEWWIVHRQRATQQAGDLEAALAVSAAAIYNLPAEKFAEYARYRTLAMDLRDNESAGDGVSDSEWQQIGEYLQKAWQSLFVAVQ